MYSKFVAQHVYLSCNYTYTYNKFDPYSILFAYFINHLIIITINRPLTACFFDHTVSIAFALLP